MSDKRQRLTGRKTSGSFMQIPHAVIEHQNYSRLSHRARSLLWDLCSQFRGKNNGDLCASMSIMKRKGWKSNDQLSKAKKELLKTDWIVRTKIGGLRIGPDLFAVTFKPIDECGGKLDCKKTSVALGYWKLGYYPELNPPHRIQVQSAPPHGSKTTIFCITPAPPHGDLYRYIPCECAYCVNRVPSKSTANYQLRPETEVECILY